MDYSVKNQTRGLAIVLGLGFAGLLVQTTPSHSVGSAPETTAQTCPAGQIWSTSAKKCVTLKSENLNDEERYAQAFKLAKSGKYAQSLSILKTIKNRKDPKVLTYMGYNNRKLGNTKTGVKYYKQALAIDPNYVQAREYLGEGYVAVGQMKLAKQQLAEIKKRCGTSCEEYKDLAATIRSGKAKTW